MVVTAKGKSKKAPTPVATAVKTKRAPIVEEFDDEPAPKKKAKAGAVDNVVALPRPKNRHALFAGRLNEDNGAEFAAVVVDPEAPILQARGWINMGAWWRELTDTPGVPYGHITVIQGKPDTGKTTTAMEAMIEAQRMDEATAAQATASGSYVILLNTEYKFNKQRFVDMGGDLTKLIEIIAGTIEEAFDKCEVALLTMFGGSRIVRKANKQKVVEEYDATDANAKVLIVWDSLGMTPTEAESDGDAYDQAPATAARVIRRNLRRVVRMLGAHDIALLIVNHVYQKLNVKYGDGTAGYGGSGAYYAAVLVIEVERIGSFKRTVKKTEMKYMRVRLKLKKNHLSSHQGTEVTVNLMPMGVQQKLAKDNADERIHDGPVPKSMKKKAKLLDEGMGDDDL